jgi:hypothetical protein
MASQDGFRFTPNVVVGIAMIGAGGALLLDTLDLLNARDVVRYWPVLLILFGFSVVLQAVQGRGASGPPAGPRPIVTPGSVILLVIAGLVAANVYQRRAAARTGEGSDSVVAIMARSVRTSDGRPFDGAEMTTVMGRSVLDLRKATLAPGEEAVVDVFGMMGAVDLVVPRGWEIDVDAVPIMGRVDDSGARRSAVPAAARPQPSGEPAGGAGAGDEKPRLVVRGFIMMGRLTIRS